MSAQDQIASIESALSASQGAPVTEKPVAPVKTETAPIVEETPTPEEVETETTGDEAASSEGAEEGQRHRNKKPASERIGELTRDKRQAQREAEEARREAEHWRQVALGKKPETEAQPTQPQPGDQPKKTLADFNGDIEAFADHLADVKAEQAIKRRESAEAEGRQREEAQKVVKSYRDRVEAWNEANPDSDYDEMVTNGNLKISGPMADFIIESEIGPQIGVYFHDNPDEAAKIFAMQGTQRDRALARLETKLSAPSADEPAKSIPPAPPQITRAPPVPRQVQGGKTGAGPSTVESEIAAVRALRQRT